MPESATEIPDSVDDFTSMKKKPRISVENEDAHDAQQNQSRPSKMRIMQSPRGGGEGKLTPKGINSQGVCVHSSC